jgi:hypothetical protein
MWPIYEISRPAMAATVTAASLIANLISLCQRLPKSVPVAHKDDDIYRIIRTAHGDDPWQSFNRKFDLLYGEDCRDAKGYLRNIRSGKYGLDSVCAYLKGINTNDPQFLAELAVIKLERLRNELVKLKYALSII